MRIVPRVSESDGQDGWLTASEWSVPDYEKRIPLGENIVTYWLKLWDKRKSVFLVPFWYGTWILHGAYPNEQP